MFPPSQLLPNSHYLPTYLILCSFSLFQITQTNQINERNKRNKFLKNHKNTKIKTKENRQKTIKTKKNLWTKQNKSLQKYYWVHFVLAKYSWAWGSSWRVIDILLEKPDFFFAIDYCR